MRATTPDLSSMGGGSLLKPAGKQVLYRIGTLRGVTIRRELMHADQINSPNTVRQIDLQRETTPDQPLFNFLRQTTPGLSKLGGGSK